MIGEFFIESFSQEEQTEIKSITKKLGTNISLHLQRIESEEEFNRFYEIADMIYAIYDNFDNFDKSSNALSKACMFKKPVLVAEGKYLMAGRVKEFNLGYAVDENNPEECLTTINQILNLSKQQLKGFGFKEYSLKHNYDRMKEVLKNIVV